MAQVPKPPKTYRQFIARYPKLGEAWDNITEAGEDGPLDDAHLTLDRRKSSTTTRLLDIVPIRSSIWILVLAAGCTAVGNQDTPVPSEDGLTASAGVTEVSVAEGEALLKSGREVVVLDVRTSGEFAGGHMAGALNVDFRSEDFEVGLDRLDREVAYLLHCASGRRSARALESMRQKGFQSVYHLTEGFGAWVRAGKPVER